jgi:predicted  nucleic acid-binding Zn-ribbon protein
MNRVSLLSRLQTIDNELDDKTKRACQVDEQLASDPSIAAARAALDAEQKRLADLRGALRDRELEAKGLDAKIKEIENRLYSGRVTNPKELDGMEKDLQMHKRQRGVLDDRLLELMDAVEQAQKRADDQARALKQLESARASDIAHLSREREELTARLAELTTEREQTRGALDADTLRSYDNLRRTKGRAVAQLRRDACGACGVALPTGLIQRVRAEDETVLCSSCGRILAA